MTYVSIPYKPMKNEFRMIIIATYEVCDEYVSFCQTFSNNNFFTSIKSRERLKCVLSNLKMTLKLAHIQPNVLTI
jgi:hypothetical protein